MVSSNIKNKNRGFSLIEAVLASALFALFVTAFAGTYLYSQEASVYAGNNNRATMLADEGLEAVRNMRDAGYANLVDGTYGLATSTNQWTFSGVQDVNDIFTRKVTISTVDSKRKSVTSSVSWNQNLQRLANVTLTTRLTNWIAAGLGNWASPTTTATVNLSGSSDGIKVQYQGNYAYIVQSTNPTFDIVNISNPDAPVISGTLNLSGTPTNIAVSGNYAYVSSTNNTQELQIVDISNPAAPVLAGTFDNPGSTVDARGIQVVGNYVYISFANGTSEFIILDVSVPAIPVPVKILNLSTGVEELYVNGNYAYLASADNNQELQIINISNPLLASQVASLNLPTSNNGISVAGNGNYVYLSQQAGPVYVIDVTNPLTPILRGTYNAISNVNDISVATSLNYLFLGTNENTAEMQVVDITNPTSPTLVGTWNSPIDADINGVAYVSTIDKLLIASRNNIAELQIISPQ